MMESKKPFLKKDQDNSVTDVKVFRNAATATLNTGYPNLRWKEFIHLTKVNNEWKIINVFWEYELDQK